MATAWRNHRSGSLDPAKYEQATAGIVVTALGRIMYASLEKHEDLRRQLVSTVRTMVANTLSEEPYNTEQHRAYADSGSRERGATPWARATQGRRCGDDHRHISRGAGENRESARKMRALLERTMLTGTTCTRHSNAGGVRRPVRRGCRVPPTRSSQPHRACVGHDCRRRQTRCPRRTSDGARRLPAQTHHRRRS